MRCIVSGRKVRMLERMTGLRIYSATVRGGHHDFRVLLRNGDSGYVERGTWIYDPDEDKYTRRPWWGDRRTPDGCGEYDE